MGFEYKNKATKAAGSKNHRSSKCMQILSNLLLSHCFCSVLKLTAVSKTVNPKNQMYITGLCCRIERHG